MIVAAWAFTATSTTAFADDTVGQAVANEPAANKPAAEHVEFFTQHVEPILRQKCFKCHGGEGKIEGGLKLTNHAGLMAGGESGEAVSLDSPDESLLIDAINYQSFEMPPTGKLAPEQIATLTKWVKLGAPFPAGFDASARPGEHHGPPEVNEETKKFWAYQPVRRPDAPSVQRKDWVRTPIDAFVLAGLEQAKLAPNDPAEKTALLRRATYDLTGLPPTPEQVRAFLADESPEAFQRVVDQLLESPQYGEKWGRHWLDLVRYAETNSYERDDAKPFVWRYRDYVIRSFNDDKPYDEFIREQLAGDEMQPRTPDRLIATGYYRLGIWDDEPADRELAFYDDLDDIMMTTGQVFLGMTINCARCHDHKLDPISQRDYYSLLSFLAGLNRYGVRGGDSVQQSSLRTIASPDEREKHAEAVAEYERHVAENNRQLTELEKPVVADFQPVEVEEFKHEMNKIPLVKKRVGGVISQEQFDQYVELKKRQRELSQQKPPALEQALCVSEIGREPREMFVLARGNPQGKGDRVEPAFPEVLSPPKPTFPDLADDQKTSGRRTALANWVASPDNPLTARVMANRVWQYHFGRGLVRTPNDFGFQGERPTHPELLDWLAAELVEGGWRLKRLHRLIMNSNAYQMSSQGNEAALAVDPRNDRLWRFDMRRLEAEEIRDSILAVNGSLNLKMGGPSIYPLIPEAVLAGQSRPGAGWGNSSPEERNRRSVYIHLKRSLITPILADFDVADADTTCPVRFATTQPTQALGMLNSDFLNDEAAVFARFLKSQTDDAQQQVALAMRRAFQREPQDAEVTRGLSLIRSLRDKHGYDPDRALQYYCLVVLNLNEFMFLD
ncbi:MAG: PSD1 domain-containing protein [Planctomycetales bacterium]|nr:PSD1 domain-containing protein [Planctomycetales bacterium]